MYINKMYWEGFDMSDANLSLLTQDEIDTLVSFLVDNKNSVNNTVLNQDSIDKLITIIKNTDMNRLNFGATDYYSGITSGYLSKLLIQDDPTELCELRYKINNETNYIELYAKNTVNSKEQIITPTIFEKAELIEDDSKWGFSIPPFILDKIATVFDLKYSKETYSKICELFLEKNYESTNLTLPKIFLPDGLQLINHLL